MVGGQHGQSTAKINFVEKEGTHRGRLPDFLRSSGGSWLSPGFGLPHKAVCGALDVAWGLATAQCSHVHCGLYRLLDNRLLQQYYSLRCGDRSHKDGIGTWVDAYHSLATLIGRRPRFDTSSPHNSPQSLATNSINPLPAHLIYVCLQIKHMFIVVLLISVAPSSSSRSTRLTLHSHHYIHPDTRLISPTTLTLKRTEPSRCGASDGTLRGP